MLKRYKNALFKMAQDGGVDISSLKGVEKDVDGLPAFIVQYRDSSLKFIARHDPDNPHSFDYSFTRFGARTPDKLQFFPSSEWANFEKLSAKFQSWVSNEVRTAADEDLLPDLWSMLAAGEISSGIPDGKPFTADERRQVKLALHTFQLLVQEEFKPTEGQALIIKEQLDYLAEAVDRLNKFDWRGVAISTLMSISIALSLDVERGRELYLLFQQAFSALLHLLK